VRTVTRMMVKLRCEASGNNCGLHIHAGLRPWGEKGTVIVLNENIVFNTFFLQRVKLDALRKSNDYDLHFIFMFCGDY